MDWTTLPNGVYWALGTGIGFLMMGIIACCKLYHRQTGLEDVYGPSGVPGGGQARTTPSRDTHVFCPENTQPTHASHQYDNYGVQRFDITGIPNRDFNVAGRRTAPSGRNVVFESAYDYMVGQEKCDDRLDIVDNEVLPNTDETVPSRRPGDRHNVAQTAVDFDQMEDDSIGLQIQSDGQVAPPPPYHEVVHTFSDNEN